MGSSTEQVKRFAAVSEDVAAIARDHSPAVLACSFGAEDMVLVDVIARLACPITVVTLDTGRLPEETHSLIERTQRRYGIDIDVRFPEGGAVEALVRRHGSNGFYASVAERHACCNVRKVEPLARALAGNHAWITGLRREQSTHRAGVAAKAFDDAHGLWKFNPLADWSHDDVWAYIRHYGVPYNALHDRGYPSIGCAPCTRAVEPGEDMRAGRWWWERDDRKECGLHPRVVPIRPVESAEVVE